MAPPTGPSGPSTRPTIVTGPGRMAIVVDVVPGTAGSGTCSKSGATVDAVVVVAASAPSGSGSGVYRSSSAHPTTARAASRSATSRHISGLELHRRLAAVPAGDERGGRLHLAPDVGEGGARDGARHVADVVLVQEEVGPTGTSPTTRASLVGTLSPRESMRATSSWPVKQPLVKRRPSARRPGLGRDGALGRARRPCRHARLDAHALVGLRGHRRRRPVGHDVSGPSRSTPRRPGPGRVRRPAPSGTAAAPVPRTATIGQSSASMSALVRSRKRCRRASDRVAEAGVDVEQRTRRRPARTRGARRRPCPGAAAANDHAEPPTSSAATSWLSWPCRNVAASGPSTRDDIRPTRPRRQPAQAR